MDIALITSEHEGVAVVEVLGEVDLATVPKLRDRLVAVVGEHAGKPVVVDLDGVALLDSAGLGVLVGAQRRARTHGGEIHLVLTNERLLEVFRVTRLDGVFPVHASRSGALGVIRRGG